MTDKDLQQDQVYSMAETTWMLDKMGDKTLQEIADMFADFLGDRGQTDKLLKFIYIKGFTSGATRAVSEIFEASKEQTND
jgi:hypothetical protein